MKLQMTWYMRLVVLVGLLFSAVLLPTWVTVMVMLPLLFLKDTYYEFFLVMFTLDLLYSPGSVAWSWLSPVVYTVLGIIIFLSITLLKKKLFIYSR